MVLLNSIVFKQLYIFDVMSIFEYYYTISVKLLILSEDDSSKYNERGNE